MTIVVFVLRTLVEPSRLLPTPLASNRNQAFSKKVGYLIV